MTHEKEISLQFIENIITSMREASFKCKEFCILICSAFLTVFAATELRATMMVIMCCPIILLFWIIDSFYLCKERILRDEYKRIAQADYEEGDNSPLLFSTKLMSKKEECKAYFKAMVKSISTIVVYLSMLLFSAIFGILLLIGVL